MENCSNGVHGRANESIGRPPTFLRKPQEAAAGVKFKGGIDHNIGSAVDFKRVKG